MRNYIFTSESVSEGHPDKVCDLVSDTILDACLARDPHSRVACECYATTGMLLVGGEITTDTYIDIQKLVRKVIRDIGYIYSDLHFSADSISVINVIDEQSHDISYGITKEKLGAGDQGIMFGYACNETPEYMPAPLQYAHNILKKASELRKNGSISWLRPDAKSQVSLEYENNIPKRIDSIVLSHQHSEDISQDEIKEILKKEILFPVLEKTNLIDEKTSFFINPSGRFVTGGPHADTGLTGRKTIVDTYGGASRHGGGAFSGKDGTKVDRSASYMARYIAKNIVAAQLADKIEIQLSYAIGYSQPLSLFVNTFGTSKMQDKEIIHLIKKNFDLSPQGIIELLSLNQPIFTQTTNYGHFGKNHLLWEQLNKISDIT